MILKLLFILVTKSKNSKLKGLLILLDLQVTRYSSYLSNEVVEHALTDFTSKKVHAIYCKVHILKSTLITAVMNSTNNRYQLKHVVTGVDNTTEPILL